MLDVSCWKLVKTGTADEASSNQHPTSNIQHPVLPLLPSPSLMRGRNLHVFAIFCHRAPRHVDTLPLKQRRDMVVGQRLRTVFLVDHLLYLSFQNEQRHCASRRPLDRFGEEISQLENSL